MSAPPVVIGDVIAGKYVVERIIGEGGMGVVLAARHLELEQRVAIKFLLPEIAEQGMAAERFRREARAAARIRGQHVCRVLDVGTLETGVPFMVMEYLDGCDLATELEQRGQLPCDEAIGYVLQACEALAEAHATGVIHRDLKPANLFLEACADGSRRVKVLDFGVSKSLLDGTPGRGAALTKTSSLVGSPLYMSPEQLDSARDVDPRTDIWALGVVLYELIAGRTPFQGESIPQLVTSVLHDPPRLLADQNITVPDGLEDVLRRALSKQRALRFGSVAEFVIALMPYAPPQALGTAGRVSRLLSGTEPVTSSSLPAPTPSSSWRATPASEPATRSTPSGLEPGATPLSWDSAAQQRKNRRMWAGLIAVLCLGLLAGGYLVLRGRGAPASEAANQPADGASPTAPGPTVRTAEPVLAPTVSAAAAVPPAVPAEVPSATSGSSTLSALPAAPPPAAEGQAKVNSDVLEAPPPAAAKPTAAAPPLKPAAAREPPESLAHPRPRVEPEPVRPVKNPAPPSSISDFGGRR